MDSRSSQFARWSTFIHTCSLIWLVAALAVALWPIPGKYPFVGPVGLLLAATSIVAGFKMWIDDVTGLVGAIAILVGLAVWTAATWLPKSAWLLVFFFSGVVPFLSVLTLLVAAGSASDPYNDWDDVD